MANAVIASAGDVLTLTVTGSNTPGQQMYIRVSGTVVGSLYGTPNTLTYTFPASGTFTVIGGSGGAAAILPGTARLTCTGSANNSSSPASPTSPSMQSVNNANTGIVYGQQTLQNYNDWTNKAVISSFTIGTEPSRRTASAYLKPLSMLAKVERLTVKEQDLASELAELRSKGDAADSAAIADLELRLAETRRSLTFARLDANLASADGTARGTSSVPVTAGNASRGEISELRVAAAAGPMSTPVAPTASAATQVYDGPVGNTQQAANSAPALHLNARDLGAFCNESCEVLDRRWNVWMEARLLSASDSVAQTNALGFVGSAGGDYKPLPWLALGMSLGVESYQTNFGTTAGSRTTGVTVMPYAGFRLDDNVFASTFVGISNIAYNNTPAPGVSAQFTALRFFVGGALTGVWHDGPWRLQPTLAGTYGSETQYAYTDSIGNAVPSQMVSYGRLSAGPEIGYTVKDIASFASVEPFVTAKANLDFATSTVALFNGMPLVARSGTLGSGSAGLGFALAFDSGFYLRVQGSYDSIGVAGLDIMSGLVRGGLTF